MTDTPAENEIRTDLRPTGLLQPENKRALSALIALGEKRIADAEKHAAAIPDSPMIDRAWKLLLRGLLLVGRLDLNEAELCLLQACSLAFIHGRQGENEVDSDALRLCARALHHIGWIYRRQDRPDDAYRTHMTAHRLREQYGSFEELWETAIELGLDADVARRHEDARRWQRAAIAAAERASIEPARKRAIAWTDLATSFAESGEHDEAVAAAGTARDWWREHDIGAAEAALADLTLATALLKQGEALHERNDERTRPVLTEAVKWLTTARNALLAFGQAHTADAEQAREQKDFAERLLASFG
ncbi:MAG: hypothetical protein WBE26_19235 [Phycisphaerae bacterium]